MSARLGEAGAPLQPRIESEIANHDGYVEGCLKGREFFVGDSLTGADIDMSFVAEVARAQKKLEAYPNFNAWLDRMHARPAWQRALEKGGDTRWGVRPVTFRTQSAGELSPFGGEHLHEAIRGPGCSRSQLLRAQPCPTPNRKARA